MNSPFNIDDDKLDINFVFYNLLKRLIGLRPRQIDDILITIKSDRKNTLLNLGNVINRRVKENDTDIVSMFEDREYFIELLEFTLRMLQVKPVLLEQAKLIASNIRVQESSENHKLSLAFDTVSLGEPYYARVSGALLTLIWFEKTSYDTSAIAPVVGGMPIAEDMKRLYNILSRDGLEANQIFMIIFNESISQSIRSNSGSDYESRVNSVLNSLGISDSEISKGHDSRFIDMEYDHIFNYNGKKIGISSKRTLRERYKQFLHYTNDIDVDVLINITIGVDLNKQKLDNISKYGIYTVVADEIYEKDYNEFMRLDNLVVRSSEFNKDFLDRITE